MPKTLPKPTFAVQTLVHLVVGKLRSDKVLILHGKKAVSG